MAEKRKEENELHSGNPSPHLKMTSGRQLKNNEESNSSEVYIPENSHGVFAGSTIEAGVYLAEYSGEQIEYDEGEKLIEDGIGQYVYFFDKFGKNYCINAMFTNSICKFVNDSPKKYANSYMKVQGDPPKLVLYSKKKILGGDELRYPYDEDKERMWWRSLKRYLKPLHMPLNSPSVTIEQANRELFEMGNKEKEHKQKGLDLGNPEGDLQHVNKKNDQKRNPESDVFPQVDSMAEKRKEENEFDFEKNNESDSSEVYIPENSKFPLSSEMLHKNTLNLENAFLERGEIDDEELSLTDLSFTDSGLADISTSLDEVEGISLDMPGVEMSDSDDKDYVPSFSGSETEDEGLITAVMENIKLSNVDYARSETEDEGLITTVMENIKLSNVDFAINSKEDRELEKTGDSGVNGECEDKTYHNNDDDEEEEEDNPKKKLILKLEKMNRKHKYGHKSHNCIYCNKVYPKLPRHLEQVHYGEDKVKEALSYPVHSKIRNQKWAEIRREGDFVVNMDAYQQNLEPLAVRDGKTDKERLPCDGCRGFFDARRLSRHKCFLKDFNDSLPYTVKSSRVFLAVNAFNGKYQEVQQKIISGIKDPVLNLVIRNDSLLLALAAVELDHKEKARHDDIRYTLRVLAKFLIEFRTITNENMRAIDLVQPDNYDQLLKAMKNLAGYQGRTNIKNPHLVLKIGYSLRTLIILAKLMYTKSLEFDNVKKMKAMMTLYTGDYSKYSNNAKVLYELRRGNAPEELPLESDLKKLRNHCIREIESLTVQGSINQQEYVVLNKLCFTRLLTFNARRGGEPGKLTLDIWKDTLNDTWKRRKDIESLTDPVEIKLAERLKLCYLPGKKKKKGSRRRELVPMLFTEEVVAGITLLIKYRSEAAISEENNYVFACGSTSQSLRGWDTLQGITRKLDLIKPKLITPTRTRKAVSTMMQLLDLSDGELNWITNHMGHCKDIQFAWYRKEDSTLELTKVARALMQVDVGSRKDLQNKRIDDLTLRCDDSSEEKGRQVKRSYNKKMAKRFGKSLIADDDQNYEPPEKLGRIRTPFNCITNQLSSSQVESRHALRDLSDNPGYSGTRRISTFKQANKQKNISTGDSYEDSCDEENHKLKSGKKKMKTWKKWTTEEKSALMKAFLHNINRGIGPLQNQVVKAQENFPILRDISQVRIKAQVHNLIKAKKKQLQD